MRKNVQRYKINSINSKWKEKNRRNNKIYARKNVRNK